MRIGEAAVFGALLTAGTLAAPARAAPEQALDEVVVTGSRLTRSTEEATGPVTVLDKADLERGIPDSLGEILLSLPLQNGATQTLNDNDNDGATRVNLRGLGPDRTLVLLNGRRFVFGGTGADQSVDLDMIPLSMIERVEISTSGATSIYGSDAVAGVVNVITRRNFTGLETSGAYHVSERGDGAVRTGHALFGADSARGNFIVGLEYLHQDGVLQSARAYSSHVESLAAPNGPMVDTGSLNNPYGFFVLPVPNVLDPSGLGSGWYTRIPNASGRGLNAYKVFDPATDLYNYAPQAYLQTPTERGIVWVSGRYELGSSTEWFVEGLFHRGHTAQQYSPATYSSFNLGAAPTDPQSGNHQFIPASNYYNPFGSDLIGVISTLSSGGPRTFDQHLATYRVVSGLRGSLGTWQWNGAVTWAQSDADEYLTGMVLRRNVRNAVGPSGIDAAGNIVCGSPDPATGLVSQANIVPGCVPLDLFDGPQGASKRQLAYIERDLRSFGRNRHIVTELSLSGPAGHLPAGDVQWALGAEYRRESASNVQDPQAAGGVTGFVTADVPNPSIYSSRELFAELRAPLLEHLRGVESLELVAGARYSRYSAFGGTNSLQGGLHWRVSPHITLRGGYSTVFRAPGLSDLFQSQVEEARPITDPCGSNPTAEQRIHCAAAGVPAGAYVQSVNEPVDVIFGGNPGLRPERGTSWTSGFLLRGSEASGWTMSVDYWRVQLRDALDSPGPDHIVDQCAATGSAACALIERATNGSIIRIDSTEHNLTHQTQYGLDLSTAVHTDLPWGTLAATLSGAWLLAVRIDDFVSGVSTQSAGTRDDNGVAWPKIRMKGTLDWRLGPWRLAYNAQFIDSMVECGDKNLIPYLLPTDCRTISSRLYHDLFATYEWRSGVRLNVGVENILDTRPPFVNTSYSANTDASIYALLGRTYRVSLGYRLR